VLPDARSILDSKHEDKRLKEAITCGEAENLTIFFPQRYLPIARSGVKGGEESGACDGIKHVVDARERENVSYWLFIRSLVTAMVKNNRKELQKERNKLKNGLDKLQQTNEVVASLQKELSLLQPELTKKVANN
jgi:hypothetical protein